MVLLGSWRSVSGDPQLHEAETARRGLFSTAASKGTMSPANRAAAMGNDFPRLGETTIVSMRSQNAIIDQISLLSAFEQAPP
jgi:hypothetical protein